ncbi:unnamed protein product [Symbiodinium natans]|uniref:Pentatricopeptide repeat-containing protein n=1 Tax=Symbiodinium natans TaxID=878477 RepID=A0A812PUQ9_9DINO|nr:unnamed protein product [Symbiodinium natans]
MYTFLSKVDRFAFVAFVRACAQSGELQRADDWTMKLLKIAQNSTQETSPSKWKEAEDRLMALVVARVAWSPAAELGGAREWLQRLRGASIQPSRPVYGRLLQRYAEADKTAEFEKLLYEMRSARVRPETEAFNYMIKTQAALASRSAPSQHGGRLGEKDGRVQVCARCWNLSHADRVVRADERRQRGGGMAGEDVPVALARARKQRHRVGGQIFRRPETCRRRSHLPSCAGAGRRGRLGRKRRRAAGLRPRGQGRKSRTVALPGEGPRPRHAFTRAEGRQHRNIPLHVWPADPKRRVLWRHAEG